MTRSRSLARFVAIGMLVIGSSAAPAFAQSSAQSWPQRAVKFILPWGPAPEWTSVEGCWRRGCRSAGVSPSSSRTGQGAMASSRSDFVSANDDHILLCTPTGSFTVHAYQRANLPYDAKKDLLPIARITSTILAVGVPASADIGSLGDFVARARAEPGKLNAAVVPGITELVFDGFVKSSGLSIAKVPYRDIVQAAIDLGENRIQFMMAALAILRPQVEAKRIKLVAINGPERTKLFPDVPTAVEAGVPALRMEGLVGLFGLRGMDLKLRERIAADVIAVIADPEVAARLVGTAQALNPGGPAELAASVDEQTEQVAAIAKSLGMVPK